MAAKLCQRTKELRPSSQRPQYPNLYQCLKHRLGCSLRARLRKRSVVGQGEKSTHKCSRIEGGFPGPKRVQGQCQNQTVLVATVILTVVSLHKQARRNPLSKHERSPVENHDLVLSLQNNLTGQSHSRVPEPDG